MQIIPAIDLINGHCVRLTQGDYQQKKVYSNHPLEVAKMFEDEGFSRLHLVDLDGAKAGHIVNLKVLELLASKTSLSIDFGGGVHQRTDVKNVLDAGADMVTVGSVAVKKETLFLEWIEEFGADAFFLGADVKNGKIAVSGWVETIDIDVLSFVRKYVSKGIRHIFCTDVSKDGLLQGPSIDLYKEILHHFPNIHFVASGGVATLKDVEDLATIGCYGVIIGKAIYEQAIILKDLSTFNV